jgi:hypothetical protein
MKPQISLFSCPVYLKCAYALIPVRSAGICKRICLRRRAMQTSWRKEVKDRQRKRNLRHRKSCLALLGQAPLLSSRYAMVTSSPFLTFLRVLGTGPAKSPVIYIMP